MSYEQFLTSKTVITKQATMPDGTVADVHFVKCAHVDFVRWQQAEQSGKPADVERGVGQRGLGVTVELQGVVLAELGLHAARGVEDHDVDGPEAVLRSLQQRADALVVG